MRQIFIDSIEHPQIFIWAGSLDQAFFRDWQAKHNWNIPDDLLDVWLTTGGGDLFESEELRCPSQPDFDSLTSSCVLKGMPTDWLIFHTGLGISVFRKQTRDYAVVNPGAYSVTKVFRSFDFWYSQYLRNEYAERYGLTRINA